MESNDIYPCVGVLRCRTGCKWRFCCNEGDIGLILWIVGRNSIRYLSASIIPLMKLKPLFGFDALVVVFLNVL